MKTTGQRLEPWSPVRRLGSVPSIHTRTHGAHSAEAVIAPLAMPQSKWPVWAAALSFFKSEKDIGVGDTIERIIGKSNSSAFKAWHLKTFGQSCGCASRKAHWNAKFPYEKP